MKFEKITKKLKFIFIRKGTEERAMFKYDVTFSNIKGSFES